jgi:lysophospholipase L1-like esterase
MKIVTIVGDSLSMVRPQNGIRYRDTYPFKLQELLGGEYHITLFSQRANTVFNEYRKVMNDGMLYTVPDFFIFHLGIVDCSPRLFGPKEQEVVYFFSTLPIFKHITSLIINFLSKHRPFFTKHFPKTYVSKENFKKSFEFITGQIRKRTNAKIIFINIADTSDLAKNRSYGYHENITEYNKIFEDIINRNKDLCSLIDFYEVTNSESKRNKYLLPDNHHLSIEGHKMLSELLHQNIKKLTTEDQSCI